MSGIVVVDELHMVGDSHRGYLLELLLTKIRFAQKQSQTTSQTCTKNLNISNIVLSFMHSFSLSSEDAVNVQLIGMSATLPNLDLLAHWLNADLFRTDFRPVPLTEMVKVGADVFDRKLKKLRALSDVVAAKGDDEHITFLCLETINLSEYIMLQAKIRQHS